MAYHAADEVLGRFEDESEPRRGFSSVSFGIEANEGDEGVNGIGQEEYEAQQRRRRIFNRKLRRAKQRRS
jgi:hypothetical protein